MSVLQAVNALPSNTDTTATQCASYIGKTVDDGSIYAEKECFTDENIAGFLLKYFFSLTSYEMINDIKPDMTNLVPFWSPGIYHVTKDERKGRVWSAKGIYRMLGYDNETKGGMKVRNIKNYKA